ncbi:phosphate ABC transporter substrate-binding protein [Thalassotalea euphylliae]|uniref:phosphate ABC transporter substrate-binding protein n=1 Tax=Thalassotalea euphylliae TaxID=1655234 RepID=UPI0036274621
MKTLNKVFALVAVLISFSSVAEVSVIVNSANADAIDAKIIKRIYLGKAKSFPGGGKASVLSLPDSVATTEDFRQKALSKSNSQFKSYWSKLAFTGKGTPPKEIANDGAMIDAVKSDPNAIGFVDSNSVTGDVKVVATF